MRKSSLASKIRVAIVDDHPMVRRGVSETLSEEADIELAGVGGSAHDAIRFAREERPDLILLDIALPGGGIEAAEEIAKSYPDIKVVMLTVREDRATVKAALRAGARGYLVKGVDGPELRRHCEEDPLWAELRDASSSGSAIGRNRWGCDSGLVDSREADRAGTANCRFAGRRSEQPGDRRKAGVDRKYDQTLYHAHTSKTWCTEQNRGSSTHCAHRKRYPTQAIAAGGGKGEAAVIGLRRLLPTDIA